LNVLNRLKETAHSGWQGKVGTRPKRAKQLLS